MSIASKGGNTAGDADIDPPDNDEYGPRRLDVIPAYACHLRHVKDVAFTDCSFDCEKPDGRPAFVIDNADTITLKSMALPFGSECSARVAVRGETTRLSIRKCFGFRDKRLTAAHRSF